MGREGERHGDEQEGGSEGARRRRGEKDLNRNRMFLTAPVDPAHITRRRARRSKSQGSQETARMCVRACVSKCVCVCWAGGGAALLCS